MKRLILIAVLFLLPLPVWAHPGRTAADGCHYCRTNCAQWGVAEGERHCHGGGEPAPAVQEVPAYIPPTEPPPPPPTRRPTQKPTRVPTKKPTPTVKPKAKPVRKPSAKPKKTLKRVVTPTPVKGLWQLLFGK